MEPRSLTVEGEQPVQHELGSQLRRSAEMSEIHATMPKAQRYRGGERWTQHRKRPGRR